MAYRLLCNIWSSARAGVCWQAALACIRAVVFPHYSCVDGWDGPILQIFGLWSNDYEGLEEARDESQPLAEPRLLNHRRYGLVLRANILPLLVARIYIKPCGLFRQILFILGQAASFLMIGVA
jgi:hypothetical protein